MYYEKSEGNNRKSAIRRRRELVMRDEEEFASAHDAIQPKLEISQPEDAQEKEADMVARKVVEGGDAQIANPVSASSSVNTKSEGDSTLYADDKLQRSLDSSKGSGQSMDDATKSEMETKMGADFSGVKIHTGSAAHEMSEDINAKAFTHEQDVYFKNLQYDPKSNAGKELLAHELWHTRQNLNNGINAIQREILTSDYFKTETIVWPSHPKPKLPNGFTEIVAGYERTLKNITDYYGLDYKTIRDVNATAYLSIYNYQQPAMRLFKFDTEKLHPDYPVFLPEKSLLRHSDLKGAAPKQTEFKSLHFKMSKNERLFKVLRGEEQIEVGESDAEIRNYDHGSVNYKGRIYLIQEALLFIGKFDQSVKLLNGDFSEGGKLHKAIEALQRELKIFPTVTNNPQWKSKTKSTLLGIIDWQILSHIDTKLLEYENELKPFYTYGSKEDKLKGTASEFDFNKYEKGTDEDEKEYTNQDIKLNGDLFNVNVFSHSRAAGGNVVDLRLTYKGEGESEKDKPAMAYFSHVASVGYGSGSQLYKFHLREVVTKYPKFDFLSAKKQSSFMLPINFSGKGLRKSSVVDDKLKNTFGYSMGNMGGQYLPDNPYGIPAPWQPWSVQIDDQLEYDESWTPSARVHRLIIKEDDSTRENSFVIIPNLAVRTSDIEKDPNFGVNFDDAAKQDGLTSLKLAIDMYNNVLTADLKLKSYKDGKGIPWLPGDTFMNYNTEFVYNLVLDKQSKKKVDPKKAGALLETMLMAQESLSMHLGTYLSLPTEQQEALNENLLELVFRWNWATYSIYTNFDEGFAYAVEAKKISKAIEYQMELMEVQEGGGMDARLNRAAQTYFGISSTTGKPALNAVIEKELLRSKQQLEKRRVEFFHPGDAVTNQPEEEDTGLGTDILIGLIEILSIQHLHDTSKDMIDKSDDYTFIWERVNKSKTAVLAELDRSRSISRIEDGFQKGGVYVQLVANQEIALFYQEVSRPHFQDDINAMIAHIQAVTEANAIFDSIVTNVIAFVVAEILTLGFATFLLPEIIAAEVGVMSIRVMGAVRTIRGVNLLRNAFSITAFTFVSRQLSEGTGNESKNSFAGDLLNNLVMIGMMGASMKGFSNIIGKIAPNLGKWGKFGVAQIGALGSLQLFAEGHHLISEGRLMNADERTKSFFSNMGLHFGMMLSGLVLSRQLDIAYRKAYSEIFQVEFKTLFNPKFEKMQSNRSELSDLAADMMMKGHVTPEFLNKMGEYFKLEKELNNAMREQLKTVKGEEGELMRAEFEKENARMDQEVQSLVDAQQLKLALLGVQGKPGTSTGLFKIKSDKRLSVQHSDLARVRMMLEGEGGVKAKMNEIEKEKIYRVQLADGTVFYLEVEGRVKTPFEAVEEKLGAGGWKRATEAFWADERMKEFEDMKGSGEVNELIRQMVEEDWKPEMKSEKNEKLMEKYREKMKSLTGKLVEKNNAARKRKIASGAKKGKEKNSATEKDGTIKMELHPDYKKLLEFAQKLGYEIHYFVFSENESPGVSFVEITNPKGEKRIIKQLHLVKGMRFLDLEHEIDHIQQFESLSEDKVYTEKVIEYEGTNGEILEKDNPDQSNLMDRDSWQYAVFEFHVRLKELIRLKERNVDQATYNEHYRTTMYWQSQYYNLILKSNDPARLEFVVRYFADIPDLFTKLDELNKK